MECKEGIRRAFNTQTPMLLTHRCRPPICISQWHRTVRRRYATGTDGTRESPATKRGDPEWFQKLRKEMLERKLPPLHDAPTQSQEDALAIALSPYLPFGFETRQRSATLLNGTAPPHSIGNHFVFFNPKVAPEELLPDGTDSLHSPGHPFVRRVWAGGSIKVNLASYFQPVRARGWDLNRPLTCVERIKDVTLRNSAAETKKIIVTIERRYEKTSAVQHSTDDVEGKGPSDMPQTSEQHVRPGEEWGDAVLIEERNLVFMSEISKAKLEAVNNGQVEPKYLRGLYKASRWRKHQLIGDSTQGSCCLSYDDSDKKTPLPLLIPYIQCSRYSSSSILLSDS